MKLANIRVSGEVYLAVLCEEGCRDLTAARCPYMIEDVISGSASIAELESYLPSAPLVPSPDFANIVNRPGKLLCVGLNYAAHAAGVNLKHADSPILFSKFNDALAPSGAEIELPPWENSYDYEAELVIVMGKTAWGVGVDEAMDYVFGFTAGNDFSCRDPQMRTSQWLIGKTMPGFGPCGPCIVTADEFALSEGRRIRSFVNGELRQDGNTRDMIFSCAEIISHASRYMRLEPGDLIFTGTPSGVILEQTEKNYLKPRDRVDVEIERIGTLTSFLV